MTNKYDLRLDAALSRVLQELEQDFIPDVIDFKDFKGNWDNQKAIIENSLNDDSYQAARPALIEVPKDSLMSRPISLLSFNDRVVYEAIVEKVADAIEEALPNSVHSSRTSRSGTGNLRERNGVDQWIGFQTAGRALYRDDGYEYMISTDVASYFEHIKIQTLVEELGRLPDVEGEILDLLSRFLNGLERGTAIWGLPQSHRASSILGSFYLLPLDRYLESRNVRYVRFQDDIRIFARSSEQLMQAFRGSIELLRSRNLNFGPHKTELAFGDQIINIFDDLEKESINYGILIHDSTSREKLCEVFDRAVNGPKINARDVKFCIGRFTKLQDPYAVNWILNNFDTTGFIAPHLTKYLYPFLNQIPKIEQKAFEFINQSAAENFPFSTMHLIRLLYRTSELLDETRLSLWKILRNANSPNYLRQYAARCLGKHCTPQDLPLFRQAFESSSDFGFRRSLLVSMTDAGGVDRKWLGQVRANDPSLTATCNFLLRSEDIPEL